MKATLPHQSISCGLQQAKLGKHDDEFDEELGLLSDAMDKLKGRVKQIDEEVQETGKIQDLVAKQLDMAQVAMKGGVKKMKKMHRDMTSSFGHMIVLPVYAVVLILSVVFLSRIKAFVLWIL